MKSTHQRNVRGMHAAPRCQGLTTAGHRCNKPAVKGKTRCETHGGNGAASRNYAERARNEKRGELQWQLNLKVREVEKLIRKLKRSGESTQVIEDLARERQELLQLAGQEATPLAGGHGPIENDRVAEAEEPMAELRNPEIRTDHPWRHLHRDRARGAMLGLAVGEAVGITLFRQPRGSFIDIEHMWGGGLLGLKAGQWADDTAMAIALIHSLIHRRKFDRTDFLERLRDWRDHGAYSCTGRRIGVDAAIAEALARFEAQRDTDSGGPSFSNASLVRIAPVAVRYWQQPDARREVAIRQSLVSHSQSIVSMACAGFADIVADAIADRPKSGVLARRIIEHDLSHRSLAIGGCKGLKLCDISGGGDALSSLEAALWCVGNNYTFKGAVLAAANLGDDAGSTAALAGQLAGALYGAKEIPSDWLRQLAWRERIVEMTDALFDQGPAPRRATRT